MEEDEGQLGICSHICKVDRRQRLTSSCPPPRAESRNQTTRSSLLPPLLLLRSLGPQTLPHVSFVVIFHKYRTESIAMPTPIANEGHDEEKCRAESEPSTGARGQLRSSPSVELKLPSLRPSKLTWSTTALLQRRQTVPSPSFQQASTLDHLARSLPFRESPPSLTATMFLQPSQPQP